MKQIITPGEKIQGKVNNYVYRKGEEQYATIYGLLSEREGFNKIVPLKGKYTPVEGDIVIGIITEVKHNGYFVDINSPYSGFLMSQKEYNHGEVVLAKIIRVDEVKRVLLGEDRKLVGGNIIEILPVKIPRVIGKKNSMLNLIREKTGSEILVGRNGRVWIKGGDIAKAEEAIFRIEREAHTTGLTERITKMLEE